MVATRGRRCIIVILSVPPLLVATLLYMIQICPTEERQSSSFNKFEEHVKAIKIDERYYFGRELPPENFVQQWRLKRTIEHRTNLEIYNLNIRSFTLCRIALLDISPMYGRYHAIDGFGLCWISITTGIWNDGEQQWRYGGRYYHWSFQKQFMLMQLLRRYNKHKTHDEKNCEVGRKLNFLIEYYMEIVCSE